MTTVSANTSAARTQATNSAPSASSVDTNGASETASPASQANAAQDTKKDHEPAAQFDSSMASKANTLLGCQPPSRILSPPSQIAVADVQDALQQARMQAYLGGPATAGRSTQPNPTDSYAAIESRLSRSLSDWVITDSDVKAVHQQLDGLSPKDYHSTLSRMAGDGNLGTYIGEMNDGAREGFLKQARDKGYISTKAGQSYQVNPGHPQPPRSPDLYRNLARLPDSMREAIHDSNVDAQKAYMKDYRNYIDAYSDKVMSCGSEAEIAGLGKPVELEERMEPGVSRIDPLYKQWTSDTLAGAPSNQPAYLAISNRVDDLNGEIRPGSLYASGEVSWQQPDDGSGDTQLGGAIGGKIFDYGAVEAEAKLNATGIMGTPFSGNYGATALRTPGGNWSVDSGQTFQAGARIEPPAGDLNPSQESTDNDFSPSESIHDLLPIGVEVEDSGKVEMSLKAAHAETHVGGAQIGSYASSDPSSATFEMGYAAEIKRKGGLISVKAGVGMRGITGDEIIDHLNDPGIFE